MTNKNEQVELAKLAELAERYTDMMNAMKRVVELNNELTNEERNLLSVAYKNVIGTYRAPLRAISNMEQKAEGSERKRQIANEYREKIEGELKNICYEVLTLLDTYLIPKAATTESKIFYLKMKGDYYRYLAEVTTGVERQKVAEESQRAYKDGFELAKNQLAVTDPIRLGLVLNFSVFYYEILNDINTACRLAKQAFDDSLAELESIGKESYNNTTLIMQLLRSNHTLWTSDESVLDNENSAEEQQ